MKERKLRKVYWAVVSSATSIIDLYDSRRAAEWDAQREIDIAGAESARVVQFITGEVVKTVRRKP